MAKWTAADLRKLKKLYPHMQTCDVAAALGRRVGPTYQAAARLGLRKSAEYLASPAAHRFDGLKGIGARFKKGQKAWNEGVTGYMGANRTSFKKGNKPQTWRPIGAERLTKDGYVERKVSDTGDKNADWKPLHVLEWEAKHGPVPAGHLVVRVSGGVECISRAENMRRNTYHRYPQEIARLIQLRGALNRQINKRDHEKQD